MPHLFRSVLPLSCSNWRFCFELSGSHWQSRLFVFTRPLNDWTTCDRRCSNYCLILFFRCIFLSSCCYLTYRDLTEITDICDAADEALFSKILHHPNHLLAHLLLNETHTPYHLRPRRHKATYSNNQQAIWQQLHSVHVVQGPVLIDWLTILYFNLCILLYFTLRLSCWAAFCQLIINEYCIALYL